MSSSVARAQGDYAEQYKRFLIRAPEYTLQYCHIYTKRLLALRPLVISVARKRWSGAAGDSAFRKRRARARALRVFVRIRSPSSNSSCRTPLHRRACRRPKGDLAASRPVRSQSRRRNLRLHFQGHDAEAVDPRHVLGCVFHSPRVLFSPAPSLVLVHAFIWSNLMRPFPPSPSLPILSRPLRPPKPGDRAMVVIKSRANYTSPTDALILEDESGRIGLLAGARTDGTPFPLARLTATLVTGVVVALRARVQASGELLVDDVAFAGLGNGVADDLASQSQTIPRPLLRGEGGDPAQRRLLVVVSNLFVGAPGTHAASLHLFAEWLAGMAGGAGEVLRAARVVRVVVAGGLVAPKIERPTAGAGAGVGSGASAAGAGGRVSAFTDSRVTTAEEHEVSVRALRDADAFAALLVASCDVDVMPGPNDPANLTLPQLPMHPCLFPISARFSSFHPVTNPYEADICGARVLGSSGQCVADITRYASGSDVVTGFEGAAGGSGGAIGGGDDPMIGTSAGATVEAVQAMAAALSREGDGAGGGDEEGGAAPPAALAKATGGTCVDTLLRAAWPPLSQ